MASWTAERGVFVVALALVTACGSKSADSGSAAFSGDTGASDGSCETQPWSWQLQPFSFLTQPSCGRALFRADNECLRFLRRHKCAARAERLILLSAGRK